MCIGPCIILIIEEWNPTRCHLLLYYAYVTAFGPETHPSLKFHPAATREPDDLYGNQRYRRELLTIGIMVPETYWA